ncbi:xanthine dehydrogenase family protein molybdopterin-binding subunit [Pedobacter sp. MC2016-14]|uniref:xanthine dehydrogenase family protein molybdopterin-binding subunit n=1 Tax=Pedobacter sp. MC2016-14 TaxID=2897327 RepID=UPI001E422DF5|nr:xanthine dehydrogenase family protein molybdopterin-binding subunit [Pedobacter sp. MC2016-14]MCD0489661.1 xanthine dehydrogenase family protein molybdopterin-binding subunit [Pedobacter sp. MC2016-14]
MNSNYTGQPANRVDGPLKVTGKAKYAAEFFVEGMLYGYVFNSAIAKGSIKAIDTTAVLSVPGVSQIFTHENVSGLAWFNIKYKDMDSPRGNPFRPLHDAKIHFSMQPIGLVVAESFEIARYAASLVKVTYKEEKFTTNLQENLIHSKEAPMGKIGYVQPKSRGDAESVYAKAEHKIEGEYVHGAEHHNPLEMFATTAVWEDDDHITLYDKTQGVGNVQFYISNVFGLSLSKVRVISPYVGGAFGSGLRPQYQAFMATLAALELRRPVRVVMTRQQMFSFGHRPGAVQRIAMSADADGKLTSIQHGAFGETSQLEDYTEIVVNWSGTMYNCENVALKYELVKLDVSTPTDMRAPGAVTSAHAFESAIDEMAYEVKIDPLQFRKINYAEEDQVEGKPYSSKELRACYDQGAAKFGWDKRPLEPRSMREGNQLVGWGMANGAWDALTFPARAEAILSMDGKLVVSSGTSDIGTGTYTIMTQIAAETLGLSLAAVSFKLGDTKMPFAPIEGGSWTAASVGSAVKAACEEVKAKLFKLARRTKGSALKGADKKDMLLADGAIYLGKDPAASISIVDLMRLSNTSSIKEKSWAGPNPLAKKTHSFNSHAAVFAEVKVDEDLGTVIVSRVVCAVAAGRILNPKTAGSQILGAVVWGISKALEEESIMDNRQGRFMNHSLAEYHVPVNKDINEIEVIFVEEKDDLVNPLGVKGVGEIGIIAVAPAIANAVFHATGVRVRNLPITMDKVLQLAEEDKNQESLVL